MRHSSILVKLFGSFLALLPSTYSQKVVSKFPKEAIYFDIFLGINWSKDATLQVNKIFLKSNSSINSSKKDNNCLGEVMSTEHGAHHNQFEKHACKNFQK